MQETIQRIIEKIKGYWKSISTAKKVSLASAAIIVIVLFFVLISYFTKVEYKVLSSGLTLKELNAVTSKLTEYAVDYKIQDNSTVLVPADQVSAIRVRLAGENLPTAAYSYNYDDMFRDSGWSQTDFERKIRLKRLKEAALQKDIETIEGITSASVILTIPENSNFVLSDQEALPSASVTIVWDGGGNKRSEIVKSIQNLVASSEVKLLPENVAVIDNKGNLLSSSTDDVMAMNSYAVGAKTELIISQKISQLLEYIVGRGNYAVAVAVQLNLDVEKVSEVKFSPPVEGEDDGLIRSADTLKESMQGSAATGAPGSESNVEDYDMISGDNSSYTKEAATINRELNEMRREVRKTPGQIENITISVLLNKKALSGGELTPEKQEQFIEIVKNATGSQTTKVSVVAEDFAEVSTDMEVTEPKSGINNLILVVSVGLLLLGILLVMLYLRAKKRKEIRRLQEAEEAKLLLEAQQREKEQNSDIEDLDFTAEDSKMKTQIMMFIEQRPEAVVQLLRNWLNE